MAKRILFFLKEYDNYSQIFSEYLKIFNEQGFQTRVFDFTKNYQSKNKLAYAISIIKEIKRFKPDVIYIGDEFFSKNVFLVVLLRKLFFFKYNIIALVASQYIPQNSFVNGIKSRFLLSNISILFCRNKEEYKKIKQLRAFKNYQGLTQIYLGIPEKFFHKINQPRRQILAKLSVQKNDADVKGKYILGFAGRIVPEKGLMLLLEALERLPDNFAVLLAQRIDDHNLDYYGKVNSFIESNKLVKRIIWIDNLDNDDIKYLYNAADLMIMPTTTKYDGFLELFGSVIAESMLCQTLVIGSDNGSIPEVIDNPKFIFKQNDVNDMVRVINFVYQLKSGERQKVVENNYQKALQDYSDTAFVSTIIKAIHFTT